MPHDPDIDANLNLLTFHADDRFYERRIASRAETAPQISTIPGLVHCRSPMWANEDDIADRNWPIKRNDTPETEGLARCQIDPKPANPPRYKN